VRARLLRWILWAAGFACLWLPVLDDPPLRTGAYLQDVTADAATVAMITAAPARLACTVRDADGNVVAAAADPGERRRHALRVTGLRPGSEYRYTVEENGAVRDGGRLRTAPADDRSAVRFGFLGDSGAQPWWVWLQDTPLFHLPARWGWLDTAADVSAVAGAVAAADPAFVLHLGDIVYPWGRHAHYATGFFRPFAAALRNAPLYAALGNHDTMDCGGLQALANLRLPAGEATGDARCHAFAWGCVRVVVIDTDWGGGARRFEPGHPAYDFLDRQLVQGTEPWLIVASHYPIRSASRQRNRADLMLSLLPLLEQHCAALYLSGHDHCYQRFGPPANGDGVALVVSGGGGKSLYEVRPDPGAAALASSYHWCSLEVARGEATLEAHGIDGRAIDRVVLRLPREGRLEALRQRNPGRAARIESLQR